MKEQLPSIVEELTKKYPGVWEAYNQLGEAVSDGPLSEREIRLVKLAIAIGAQRQGAVHSHANRAIRAGLKQSELEQVALLGITTIGWSGAIAAYSWILDKINGKKGSTLNKKGAPGAKPVLSKVRVPIKKR